MFYCSSDSNLMETERKWKKIFIKLLYDKSKIVKIKNTKGHPNCLMQQQKDAFINLNFMTYIP